MARLAITVQFLFDGFGRRCTTVSRRSPAPRARQSRDDLRQHHDLAHINIFSSGETLTARVPATRHGAPRRPQHDGLPCRDGAPSTTAP